MTLPIVPGPFEFLQGAGEAAGAIGQAVEQRRTKLEADARARLGDILSLINAGAPAEPFLGAGGAALERLGLAAPGQGAATLAGPAERARIALHLAQSQEKTAAAGATKAGAEAVVAPRVAEAGAVAAEAGAVKAQADAAAAQSDLPVRQRINELITTDLKNPETGFGKLAARAAAGTLPYYTAILHYRYMSNSLDRERLHDLFTLFFEPMNNATGVWDKRVAQWKEDKRIALLNRPDDKEYEKQYDLDHPEPQFEAVQQELLEGAAKARGLTVDQYNQKLNQTVGLVGQAEEIAMPPAKIEALRQRVSQVMSGAKTPQQVEQEINIYYRTRGGADAALMAQLDMSEFRRMLTEAQGKPGGKRK